MNVTRGGGYLLNGVPFKFRGGGGDTYKKEACECQFRNTYAGALPNTLLQMPHSIVNHKTTR